VHIYHVSFDKLLSAAKYNGTTTLNK